MGLALRKDETFSSPGTEIDVADFVYQSETSIPVTDLMSDVCDLHDLINQEIERVSNEVTEPIKQKESDDK